MCKSLQMVENVFFVNAQHNDTFAAKCKNFCSSTFVKDAFSTVCNLHTHKYVDIVKVKQYFHLLKVREKNCDYEEKEYIYM